MNTHTPIAPRSPLLRTAVAALLAAAALPVGAADAPRPDTSNWTCSSCPFFVGYDGEAEAGGAYADGANASFGRYNGIDEDGGYADVGANGQWRSERGLFARYTFTDLGLDSRAGSATFGREGRYDLTLSYDGLPFRYFDDTLTPFRGAADLTLPAGWVRAGQTAGFTQLNAALTPRAIGTERRTVGVGARWHAGTDWTLFANWRRQEREGTGIIGGSFLTQAALLPEPIDWSDNVLELGAAYGSRRNSARIAYTGSRFNNRNVALTWDNPFTPLFPAAGRGRLALAPDSASHQLALSGSSALGDVSTLSWSTAFARLTQDDWLLPVSTAPNARAPAGSLDGEVQQVHYGLAFSSRPLPAVTLRASARYDDRDDSTDRLTIASIVTDTVAGATDTTPRYDYSRTRLDGSVEWRVTRILRVAAGAQSLTIDRREQEIRRTADQGSWLQLRLAPGGRFAFAARGGSLHREAEGFDPARRDPGENPLLRKYNLANRDRDFLELTANLGLTDQLSLGLQARGTNDAYRRSPLGLQDGRERSGAATLTWTPRERLSLFVDGGRHEIRAAQLGVQDPGALRWRAEHEDRFWHAGGGFRYEVEGGRWAFGANLARAESTGEVVQNAVGPDPFPSLRTKLDTARADVTYRATDALSFRLRAHYEKYDSSDWQLANVGPATIRSVLTLGAQPDSHDVRILALTFGYRFGAVVAPPAAEE